MIVRLKTTSSDYTDLSVAQLYFVIGIEADDYRLLNDAGKPYLYPAELFTIVNANYPVNWITEFGLDGEQYSYPSPLNQIGFFEDFFEHKPEQIAIFWQAVNQTLAQVA